MLGYTDLLSWLSIEMNMTWELRLDKKKKKLQYEVKIHT